MVSVHYFWMMTVAAVDRMIHHATLIEVSSDSYRRKQALQKASERAATTSAKPTTISPGRFATAFMRSG